MAFLTLFLGLVTGIHPVELTVADPEITRIELRLDGKAVALLQDPPWTLSIDLGEDLVPHELEAVGFDAEGNEVDQIRQWINMPRDRAELELVLDGEPEGQVEKAQLVWSSVDALEPEAVRIYLDGEEIEGADPLGFSLPAYDSARPHLLQAEAQLGDTTVRAQAVVGGGAGSAISRHLTALPLQLVDGEKPPDQAEIQGWIEARGRPVRVVAVERPGADVVMVQDLAWYLQRRLKGLRNDWLTARITTRRRPTGLKYRDHFRILFPIPQTPDAAAIRSLQFPMSPNLWTGQRIETHAQGAVDRQTADAIPQGLMVGIPVNGERKIDTTNQHLTDAVAVAALAAAQARRARVLLLVAGSDERDHSRYSPRQVRHYLEHLNVPLRVWSPEPDKVDDAWGEVVSISTRQRLERAIRELRELLDRQLVVWVEGSHLPQELELTAAAAGRLRRASEIPVPPSQPRMDTDLEPMTADITAESEGEIPAPGAAATERPAPPEADTAPPGSVAELESFEETVEVDLVTVDVVVTGPDGARVDDLGRDVFQLYEDDEPVEISHFRPPAAAAFAPAEPAGRASPPGAGEPTSLVVYLDLFRLTVQQRLQAIRALAGAFEAADSPVRLMIVADDGALDIALTFTEDSEAIGSAIAGLQQRAPRAAFDERREALHEMADVGKAIATAHRMVDPEQKEAALTTALSRRAAVERTLYVITNDRIREIRDLFANLEQLGRGLSGVEGKRAILYLGNRISLAPGAELYQEAALLMSDYSALALELTNVPEETRQSRLASEAARLALTDDFGRMAREIAALGVTLYSLTPPDVEDASVVWRDSPGPVARPASTRKEAIRDAACSMAEETGGLCQSGGTDMEQLVAAALEDFDAAYSLAFTPDRAPDGRIHEIRVEVDRPGAELRYRDRYVHRGREDTLRDRLIAALVFGEERDTLGMELTFEPQQETGEKDLFVVPFEVRVDARRLALVPVAGGEKRRARARLLITTMDARGRTAGIQEYPIEFEVPASRLADDRPLLYAHEVRLTLAAGEQTLAVGLWDDVARTGSFARRALEIAAPQPD